VKKHKHDFVNEQLGSNLYFVCPICNKLITKGKKTPNKAFGIPEHLRIYEYIDMGRMGKIKITNE